VCFCCLRAARNTSFFIDKKLMCHSLGGINGNKMDGSNESSSMMMRPMPVRPKLPVNGIPLKRGRSSTAAPTTLVEDKKLSPRREPEVPSSPSIHIRSRSGSLAPPPQLPTTTLVTAPNSGSAPPPPASSARHRGPSPSRLMDASLSSIQMDLDEEDQEEDLTQSSLLEEDDALHRTCQLFAQNAAIVEAALQGYPNSVSRRAVIPPLVFPPEHKKKPATSTRNTPDLQQREDFTLPLHIALSHQASLPVVQLLVNAGGVKLLLFKDGPNGVSPLMLALENFLRQQQAIAARVGQPINSHSDNQVKSASAEIVKFLLRANPEAVSLARQKDQTLPLHLLCAALSVPSKLVMELLHQVTIIFPQAVFQQNNRGLTPMDVVLRTTTATAPSSSAKNNDNHHHRHTTAVVDFLQQVAMKVKQQRVAAATASSATLAFE
jgi:hypothetical protein